MDESKTPAPRPDLPASLPDPLGPPKTPATARAQRLATALRDNLKTLSREGLLELRSGVVRAFAADTLRRRARQAG